MQNKAEICEDELRLAEIQLSFSDKIFSKFYCARQELLAALDYSLISGSVKNLKIIFSTIILYNILTGETLVCLCIDESLGPFIFSKMLFIYSFHFPPSVM